MFEGVRPGERSSDAGHGTGGAVLRPCRGTDDCPSKHHYQEVLYDRPRDQARTARARGNDGVRHDPVACVAH